MKTKNWIGGLLGVALLAPALAAFTPAPAANLSYAAGSRLWLEGTSTVRSYRCEAGRIDGAVVSHPATKVSELQAAVQDVVLAVPVALLECGNGTMNGHLQKALGAKQHPFVKYAHESHTVSADGAVQMKGTLTIAGQSRPVALQARATEQANGTIRVQGTHNLKMTDYGVEPPSLMFGTLDVHDPVTVGFDLQLK